MADVFCEEYSSSLADLTCNSKPHISMLTMLAEENSRYAPQIVKSIEAHLQKVKPESKLPTLYLIDSIIKNVGHIYLGLFTQNLVSNFCAVFEKVDEKVRAQMYKLRQTWNEIFPNKKLYAIDLRVKKLDPAWPILAQPPLHINPKFLRSPAEDATMKTLQDLDGEVVRQKLLAKQQEMVRLQREKLELELLQTQAVVEEQKRQLLMHEHRLRNEQQQVDLQKKISLQQLNMGVALNAVANQGLQPDPAKLNQLKVDMQTDKKDVGSRDQTQPAVIATTTTAVNSKTSVNFSQTVISPSMSVSNKTIDSNPRIMQGSDKSVANKNQPQFISNSFQAPSHLLSNMSHLKSVIQQPFVGKRSLETAVQKNVASVEPLLEGKSDGVGLKTSPKLRSDKNEKDKNTNSKSKSPSSKKRSTSSKSKEEEAVKSKAGDGSKTSNSKELSSSLKVKDRSKSSSLSPSKSRGKSKQWSPTSTRRSSNHSRSRSPNRRDKARDRNTKRERKSPRRDKDNETGNLRGKALSSVKDSSKQDDEPPFKKSKTGDPELDEIFGGKDQDYRQLDHPVSKLSPLHSTEFQGWAQYKASRPEQFKPSMRSRDNSLDHRDPFGFGKQDLDLRTTSALPVRAKLPTPWLPYRIPKINQAKDGRPFDRPGGPAVHPKMDPRLLAQGASNYYQATRESDPSIPRALMFDRGPEIMRQADSQLRAGQLTVEQHREIMEQLAKLYELQRMRHMQREQHMRDSIMSQRNDIGQHQDVVASSPEGSPRPESETSKPKKSTNVSENPVDATESPDAVKEKPDEKEASDAPVTVESKPAEDETPKAKSDVAADEEVSIVLEAKRKSVKKEKKAIEVVISDDDDDVDDKKRRRASKDSARDPPSSRSLPPSKGSHKSMPVNTVMIDDQPREVRFYGKVAIVLLENNDPREIAFRGPPQDVMIGKQVVRLGFGNEQKEFEFENEKHIIRFGAPTRELFIDDVPYCAVFGGPPVAITLGGKQCEIRLCGPTPEVFFGDKPRHDILPQILEQEAEDQRNFHRHPHIQQPPFKPMMTDRPLSPGGRWGGPNQNRDYDQRDWRISNRDEPFQRGGRDDWPPMSQPPRGSMRFNDEPYRPERGGPFRDESRGPPMPPRGGPDVWSRRDDQRGGYRGPMPPPMRGDVMPEPGGRHGSSHMNDYYDDDGRGGPRPRPGGYYMEGRYNHGGPLPPPPPMRRHPMGGMPSRFDDPGMPMRPMAPHGMGGPPHPMGPMPPGGMKYRPPFVNYPRPNPHDRYGGPPHPDYPYVQPNQHHPVAYNPPAPALPPQIDVSTLFEKLVSTGIIPQMATTASTEPTKPEEETEKPKEIEEKVPLIELTTDSLKIKRTVVYTLLYTGIQCSSCGVRFTAEQTDKYAQHLDWHFRQNRREKDSARKALSRKWYYDVQDWVQFEEIEDLEERARSFFEIQATDEQVEESEETGPSVQAGENEEDKRCAVCQELFELYWDEEHEEWHYRDAVRQDEKNYHPMCYEDFKEPTFSEEIPPTKDEKMEEDDKASAALSSEGETKMQIDETEEVPSVKEEIKTEEEQPSEALVKEEPMETDEIETKDEAQPTTTEGGFFGVFNVLSTSYTVPPLLMWESDESAANKTVEDKSESVGLTVKEEPVDKNDLDVNNHEPDNEEPKSSDSDMNDEQNEAEMENEEEETGDLNAVEITDLNAVEITDLNAVEITGDLNAVEIKGDLNAVEITGDLNPIEITGDLNPVEITGGLNSVQETGDLNSVQETGDLNPFQETDDSTEVPANANAFKLTVDSNAVKLTSESDVVEETANVDEAKDLNCFEETSDVNVAEENVEQDDIVSAEPQLEPLNEEGSTTKPTDSPTPPFVTEQRELDERIESFPSSPAEIDEDSLSPSADKVTDTEPPTAGIESRQILEESLNESISISTISNERVCYDENIVKESEPLFASPHTVVANSGADDDVVLKESSDVVSEFSFETSAIDALEESGLQSDTLASDPSLIDKDDDDVSDVDTCVSEDRPGSAVEFAVQPAVFRGTEVSGLCSIM